MTQCLQTRPGLGLRWQVDDLAAFLALALHMAFLFEDVQQPTHSHVGRWLGDARGDGGDGGTVLGMEDIHDLALATG